MHVNTCGLLSVCACHADDQQAAVPQQTARFPGVGPFGRPLGRAGGAKDGHCHAAAVRCGLGSGKNSFSHRLVCYRDSQAQPKMSQQIGIHGGRLQQ